MVQTYSSSQTVLLLVRLVVELGAHKNRGICFNTFMIRRPALSCSYLFTQNAIIAVLVRPIAVGRGVQGDTP